MTRPTETLSKTLLDHSIGETVLEQATGKRMSLAGTEVRECHGGITVLVVVESTERSQRMHLLPQSFGIEPNELGAEDAMGAQPWIAEVGQTLLYGDRGGSCGIVVLERVLEELGGTAQRFYMVQQILGGKASRISRFARDHGLGWTVKSSRVSEDLLTAMIANTDQKAFEDAKTEGGDA